MLGRDVSTRPEPRTAEHRHGAVSGVRSSISETQPDDALAPAAGRPRCSATLQQSLYFRIYRILQVVGIAFAPLNVQPWAGEAWLQATNEGQLRVLRGFRKESYA